MEWRWGRGRGETHEGAVVQRNRAMALGFGWNLLGGARCSGRRARGGRRGNAKWDGDSVGRQRGGFRTRLRRQDVHGAWPARSGERRRVADTRRQDPEPVGHADTEDFLKNTIQLLKPTPDSDTLTMIYS